MLAFFRSFTKSWIANVFIVALIFSFAIWGIKDVFHPNISTAVVTAGSHTVEPADFKRLFDNYRKQAQQQTGEVITAQQAAIQGVDVGRLQDVTTDEALAEYVRRMGVTPSEKLIADQLKKQPAFFDSISGKFDEKAYE